MPELPDVTIYCEALRERIVGHSLERLRLWSPFVLRSVEPPISVLDGKEVRSVDRVGKRIVLGFPDDRFLVIHLMIAGRLRWRPVDHKPNKKSTLVTFHFEDGIVLFTEAGSKKRASMTLEVGAAAVAAHDRGGLDVFTLDLAAFKERLQSENHTLKRSLTDPRLFDGIGNAYSDEILHRAQLSPLQWSSRLKDDQIERLFDATRTVLSEWIDRTRDECKGKFPEKVTAFRKGMAVHGRYREPCPVCQSEIQRIRYADNETNYCATCQTNGRLLADRGLSQLLKGDWPRSLEELEQRRRT